MKKNFETVICYKLINPIIYNKGTKYETKCDEFLAYIIGNRTLEEGQAEANRLNIERPDRLWNGQPIEWNNIEYFFATRQEAMY